MALAKEKTKVAYKVTIGSRKGYVAITGAGRLDEMIGDLLLEGVHAEDIHIEVSTVALMHPNGRIQ